MPATAVSSAPSADPETRLVTLTTEEEGVAMLVGAWLGGERGVLLMQSSGVGNCINMLSLPPICHTPLPMIVTMRGDFGEFNPWQIADGQGTQAALEAMGTMVTARRHAGGCRADRHATLRTRLQHLPPDRDLIGQRVLGAKTFKELATQMTKSERNLLHRRAVVTELLRDRGDLLVIAGLGAPAWDITAAGDRAEQPAALGRHGRRGDDGPRPRAGAAEAQGAGHHRRRRDADGHRLARHHRGAAAAEPLHRRARQRHFGETGMQETHTASGVDLAGMARAAGIRTAQTVRTMEQVAEIRDLVHQGKGPVFALVKINPEALVFTLPPADGVILTTRFRQSVLGDEALYQNRSDQVRLKRRNNFSLSPFFTGRGSG